QHPPPSGRRPPLHGLRESVAPASRGDGVHRLWRRASSRVAGGPVRRPHCGPAHVPELSALHPPLPARRAVEVRAAADTGDARPRLEALEVGMRRPPRRRSGGRAGGDLMASGLVDLRSDTVTRPTPEMRRAMADAEVGDDVYGEDPTVNDLQEAFAERVGKQAALFVPSGTMGNQLALRLLAAPGTSVIAGRRQHVV